MRRYVRMIRLKRDYIKEYTWYHQQPREELQNVMLKHGMRNHSIYIHDDMLVSIFDYVGEDYEADMAAIGSYQVTQDWLKIMDPMMEPLDTRKPGEFWTFLEEITHFD